MKFKSGILLVILCMFLAQACTDEDSSDLKQAQTPPVASNNNPVKVETDPDNNGKRGGANSTTTTSTTTGPAATPETPTETPSAPPEQPTITISDPPFYTVGNGPPIGNEVFIVMGGVRGTSHTSALENLKVGYARSGFRIHYIIEPMSFAPVSAKMLKVATEYARLNITLAHVVFHFSGHGWDDHVTCEKQNGTRGDIPHSVIFNQFGNQFPKATPQFQNTRFGVILDACGQGKAADRKVAGRNGFVATSSPNAADATDCAENGCEYVCTACNGQLVPTTVYSSAFGTNLSSTIEDKIPAMKTAHDAAQVVLSTQWSCRNEGRFVQY